MARIAWDQTSEKLFEVGIDHCVHYLVDADGAYTSGVAWNGITQVSETPSGAEAQKQYADNIVYLVLLSTEQLGGTIQAFMYPDQWNLCDGNAELAKGVVIGQQMRKTFGLCYRTKKGNDVDGQDYGYKLHLLYSAKASPSERAYQTINESPTPITFSWTYTTTPINVTGHNPTALLVIDSTLVDAAKLKELEDILYGTEATEPRMPLPDEVLQILGGEGGGESPEEPPEEDLGL